MRTFPAIAAATLATLVAGCGGGLQALRHEPGADTPHRAAPLGLSRHAAAHASCTDFRPSATRAYAAVVLRPTTVRGDLPISPRDLNGYRTVLGVLGAHTGARCRPLSFRVELPGPPNGLAGWIAARAVRVYAVVDRIVVDLSSRRLVAYHDGRLQLRARVAIGAPATPTPVGRYVVNERWLLENPDNPFGIAALGISAHSDVLHDWLQHGPIALHGTNEPWTIGHAASHGCVRLRNADMRRLLPLAPAGTPVVIRR
ncbi:MAG TPA: L,D-transpeptidase [Gaiellaceae bacterium]|nr:L,D-transpeptidase [Gaiellaceae bacterium]